MSRPVRRAFVAVVTASAATLVTASAAANPPAPSSVPDPLKLSSLKTGETPYRIRRHDGGCFVYGEAGPIGKTDCPSGVDKPGEEVEREPDSGQCILIEPWDGEPKEVGCPAVLVPPNWVPPAKVKPAGAALPAETSNPTTAPSSPPSTKSGCSGCTTTGAPSDAGAAVAVAAVALAVTRRRRRRVG